LGRKLIGGEISMTADEVAECALRALAAGRGVVVPGFVNKLYTFAGARLSKALGARLAAVVLRGRRSVEGRT
jgi:short-subunit dehydrogenase